MRFNPRTGVWRASGNAAWVNAKYYAYEVQVFVRSTGNVETNIVADPYSLGAAAGSGRSLIVDLDDNRTKPRHWDDHDRPPLAGPQDIVLYELHVRDFSPPRTPPFHPSIRENSVRSPTTNPTGCATSEPCSKRA